MKWPGFNGMAWTRGATFSRASGECRFDMRQPVKFLRAISESQAGEIMVLREIEIAN